MYISVVFKICWRKIENVVLNRLKNSYQNFCIPFLIPYVSLIDFQKTFHYSFTRIDKKKPLFSHNPSLLHKPKITFLPHSIPLFTKPHTTSIFELRNSSCCTFVTIVILQLFHHHYCSTTLIVIRHPATLTVMYLFIYYI